MYTKTQVTRMFDREILPEVVKRYGLRDAAARREAWINFVDGLVRDEAAPPKAVNWIFPPSCRLNYKG